MIKARLNSIFILIILLILTAGYELFAQQTSLVGHYFINPYAYNPALAGQSEDASAFLIYRNQWVGIQGAPESQVFTLDGPLSRHPVGLGIQLRNEESNILRRFSGMVSSSYTIDLTAEHRLSFGLSLGAIQNSIEFDKIKVQDDTDNSLLLNMHDRTAFEGNAGLSYAFKKFRAGFVAEQLFANQLTYQSDADFREATFALVRHYLITLQYEFTLNKDISIQPYLLIRNAQGLKAQLEATAVFKYRDVLWGGLTYRHEAGAFFSAGAHVSNRFTFGYGYEVATTDLRYASGGSHEVILGYRFNKSKSQVTSSTQNIRYRALEDLKKNSDAQYEQLDAIQQTNEALNHQLQEYKTIIEKQNDEINKLREVVDTFDEDLKKTVEDLSVNLDEEEIDPDADYYLIVGAFKTTKDARAFQRMLRRETGMSTNIVQSDTRTWYFIYSDRINSLLEAREKIGKINESKVVDYIVGNPWVYKSASGD